MLADCLGGEIFRQKTKKTKTVSPRAPWFFLRVCLICEERGGGCHHHHHLLLLSPEVETSLFYFLVRASLRCNLLRVPSHNKQTGNEKKKKKKGPATCCFFFLLLR